MSVNWNIVRPDQLAKSIPDASLEDGRIGVALATAGVDQPIDVGVSGLSFSIGASAEVKVEAFKVKGDEDDAGVVGVEPDKPDARNPPPPIAIDGEHAWLKFGATAQVKGGTGVDVPYVKASGSAEASLAIADYHVHALPENARAAALHDATRLRLPLVLDQVLELAPKEAVALTARARLAAEVKLSWSDVFTTGIGSIASIMPSGSLLSLEIDIGALLGAGVSITDDLGLVFSREEEGHVLATVRKTGRREGKLPFEVGVDIHADGLDVALGAVLDGLLRTLRTRQFEEMLAKLDKAAASLAGALEPLGDAEKALFEAALERLGLDEITRDATTLEAAWRALVGNVREKIQEAARSKLVAGFEYEYARTSTHETIAQLDIADADLSKLHPLLVTARLGAAIRQAGPAALRSYFRRDTTMWERAYGFTLGIGKWQLLSSHDGKKLEAVIEHSTADRVNGPVRVSYLGARTYQDSGLGEANELAVDFRCGTDGFVVRPSAADLRYGLHLLIGRQGRASGSDLQKIVDAAAVWGILGDGDEERAIAQIHDAGRGQKIDARMEMKIDDALLRALASRFAQRDRNVAARALARALPWDTIALRATPSVRERVYTDLWLTYLQHQDWFRDVKSAARQAAHVVKQRPVAGSDPVLDAHWEQSGASGTFAWILETSSRSGDTQEPLGGILHKWQTACDGMTRIAYGIAHGQDRSVIEAAFGELTSMWATALDLRAFGALAVALATPTELATLERTLTVAIPADEPRTALVLGTSRKR